MLPAAIAVCIFAGIVFVAFSFTLETQSRRMSDRFTTVVSRPPEDDLGTVLRGSWRERLLQPTVERLAGLAARLTPATASKEAGLRLDRAGRPYGLTPPLWTLIRVLALLACGALALCIHRFLPVPAQFKGLLCLTTLAGGVLGPSGWLDTQIKQRQMAIRSSLPDVIDLLVVSVEAGLALDASMQEVISRRRGPLLDEFARVLAEVRVGVRRRKAWQDMAERANITELKVFTAAIVQAEELGASIAQVMRGQAESLRMRRSLSVREVAAALPIKMLFPLIFFIFPSMFVVILGPGMMHMFSSFSSIGF